MFQTKIQYFEEVKKEIGEREFDFLKDSLENDYYNELCQHIKEGGKISLEVYNSLTEGQKYHFNKHFNYRNDKVINSEYEQELKEARKQTEKDYNKYLSEQAIKQEEQRIREQKEKEQTIRQLNNEIEKLQNNLYNYNNLSPIGKRNIKRSEHEQKQKDILQKIAELKEQIKAI